jgi:hypothetical protein
VEAAETTTSLSKSFCFAWANASIAQAKRQHEAAQAWLNLLTEWLKLLEKGGGEERRNDWSSDIKEEWLRKGEGCEFFAAARVGCVPKQKGERESEGEREGKGLPPCRRVTSAFELVDVKKCANVILCCRCCEY